MHEMRKSFQKWKLLYRWEKEQHVWILSAAAFSIRLFLIPHFESKRNFHRTRILTIRTYNISRVHCTKLWHSRFSNGKVSTLHVYCNNVYAGKSLRASLRIARCKDSHNRSKTHYRNAVSTFRGCVIKKFVIPRTYECGK